MRLVLRAVNLVRRGGVGRGGGARGGIQLRITGNTRGQSQNKSWLRAYSAPQVCQSNSNTILIFKMLIIFRILLSSICLISKLKFSSQQLCVFFVFLYLSFLLLKY